MVDLAACIRDIPDFPKPGILFKDITTLLGDPAALESAVQQLAEPYRGKEIDFVAAVESRGFIFGSCIARELEAGFIPIRKPGKLPAETISASYDLEYGTDSVEVHKDAIEAGQKVLLVDDLLATGGTLAATARLIETAGARVDSLLVLVELIDLDGRAALEDHEIHSLIQF